METNIMKILKITIILVIVSTSLFSQTVSNDTSYCEGTDVKVIVNIQNYDSLLWQYNDGAIFLNADQNPNFLNTKDDTLLISNIQTSLNNYQYRCIIYYTGDSTFSDTVVIGVNEHIISDFEVLFSPNIVYFYADNNSAISYTYNFGDDSIGIGGDLYHQYENVGTYNVCLITNNICIDTVCKEIEVSCATELEDLFPTDTFVNPNQNYAFEIDDVFDYYEWSTGDSTNFLNIEYDSLNSSNHINLIVKIDSTCYFQHDFYIDKYYCQEYNIVFDTIGLGILNDVLFICNNTTLSLGMGDADFYSNNIYYNQEDILLSYLWDFNDGSAIDTGSQVSHLFSTSNGYSAISISAFDQYNCTSTNNIDVVTYVSNIYDFTNTNINQDTINLGETLLLNGSVNYQDIEFKYIYNDTMMLPDGDGGIYQSYLPVELNDIIVSSNAIKNICVNMEHSFMGDLNIDLICPSGEKLTLHTFSNGGGTYLGVPIDIDSDLNPGIGFDYCWDMNASETWATASQSLSTLTSGDYLPDNSFDSLVGCQTNGLWILEIQDNWASDNGFIFSWSIEFDSLLVNPNTNTLWTGENIDNPNEQITSAIPTSAGLHSYTFSVLNNFNCDYDTTIYVYVDDPLYVEQVEKNKINIYPNPVKNKVQITINKEQYNKNTCVFVYDIFGKLVMQSVVASGSEAISIDVSNLQKGVYFVRVGENVAKFIKN